MTRSSLKNKSQTNNFAFISNIESTNEALNDESWIKAMKEKLQQFDKNQVWQLVPKPENCSIIRTKWVYRNKLDENGKIVRNKARLVAQGYNQQEDYAGDKVDSKVQVDFAAFLGIP